MNVDGIIRALLKTFVSYALRGLLAEMVTDRERAMRGAGTDKCFDHFSYARADEVFKQTFEALRTADVTLDELADADVTFKLVLANNRVMTEHGKGLLPAACEKLAEQAVQAVERATRLTGFKDCWHWLQRKVTIGVHATLPSKGLYPFYSPIPMPDPISPVEAFAGEPQVENVIDEGDRIIGWTIAGVIDEDN